MALKRMAIALAVGLLSGLFCAYGTTMVEIPGVVVTFGLLAGIVFNRVLIGLAVGLAGGVRLLKGDLQNAALRGALIGAFVSLEMAAYSGFQPSSLVLVLFGAVYGIVADVLATRFGG